MRSINMTEVLLSHKSHAVGRCRDGCVLRIKRIYIPCRFSGIKGRCCILWRAAPAIHLSEELCSVFSRTSSCVPHVSGETAVSSSALGKAQWPAGPSRFHGRQLFSAVMDEQLSPLLHLVQVSLVSARTLLF